MVQIMGLPVPIFWGFPAIALFIIILRGVYLLALSPVPNSSIDGSLGLTIAALTFIFVIFFSQFISSVEYILSPLLFQLTIFVSLLLFIVGVIVTASIAHQKKQKWFNNLL